MAAPIPGITQLQGSIHSLWHGTMPSKLCRIVENGLRPGGISPSSREAQTGRNLVHLAPLPPRSPFSRKAHKRGAQTVVGIDVGLLVASALPDRIFQVGRCCAALR